MAFKIFPYFSIVFFLGCLFSSPLSVLADTNILNNPGFESGLVSWGSAGAAITLGSTSVNAHAGNNYLEFTSPSNASFFAADSSGQNPNFIPVSQGTVATIDSWIYRVSGDGIVNCGFALADTNKSVTGYVNTPNVTAASWTESPLSYTVPAGVSFVVPYCQIYTNTVSNTSRFDDISVSIVGSSVSASVLPPAPAPTASPSVSVSTNNSDTAHTIAPDFFGLGIGMATTPWPTISFGYVRLWDSGVRWYEMEPSNGMYNWATLDYWLSTAQAHGQKVLFAFGGTPAWTGGANFAGPPSDLNTDGSGTDQMFKDFVTALIQHVGTRIQYFEMWNEINLSTYWTGTAKQMVRMVADARAIIKAANPSAVILSPSTCRCSNATFTGGAYTTSNPQDGMDFFLSTVANGVSGASVIDGVAFHPYAPDPVFMASLIQPMRAVMNKDGVGNLPLWDTESSWEPPAACLPTISGAPASTACQTSMTPFLAESYILAASDGLDHYSWYQYDNPTFGTLYNTTTATLLQSGVAYSTVNRWLVGSTVNTCSASGTVWTCSLTRSNGSSALIVWNSAGTSSYAAALYAQYEDLKGDISPINNGTISINQNPILLTVATTGTTVSTATGMSSGSPSSYVSPNISAGVASVVQAVTPSFTRNLSTGSQGQDVKYLQVFLNTHGSPVAASGAGSRGNETFFFGVATRAALARFQAFHRISPAVGYFGPITRAMVLKLTAAH